MGHSNVPLVRNFFNMVCFRAEEMAQVSITTGVSSHCVPLSCLQFPQIQITVLIFMCTTHMSVAQPHTKTKHPYLLKRKKKDGKNKQRHES